MACRFYIVRERRASAVVRSAANVGRIFFVGIRGGVWVATAFFLSGASAIIYQVVWQRALFTIFGTSSDAVTLVVTAFMLGLGLGSLIGGRLSESRRIPPLTAFGVVEASIGVFGFLSLDLFRWVGLRTLHATGLQIGVASFAALLFPTLLMGATLPLLSAHLIRRSGNVGASVGDLYAINTLGSAVAALAAAAVLLAKLGETRAVYLAATINITVALMVLLGARRAGAS